MTTPRILVPSLVRRDVVGGVATYVRNLEAGLGRLGLVCEVVELPVNSSGIAQKRFLFEFVFRGQEYFTTLADSLFREFRGRLAEFDLVHTQDALVSRLIRRHVPWAVIVQTVHGLNYNHVLESNSYEGKVKRVVKVLSGYDRVRLRRIWNAENDGIACSDQVIAVDSNHGKWAIVRGAHPARVTVIPNAVDVDALILLARRTPPLAVQRPYFLAARRLWPKNGVVVAVRAFLEWVGAQDVRFLIAGIGPQFDEIRAICGTSENGHKVTLLGGVKSENLPSLMAGATGTIVPSVPIGGVVEATSLAALESLALGVPVIASDIGGLAEIDGGTGVMELVEPGSVQALVSAFDRVWVARGRQEAMNAARQKHVRERFDLGPWIQRIVAVYDKALSRSAA